jgi:hypothetical protein
MPPLTTGVDPFALPTIGSVESNNSLSGWLFQPLQQNSSGTLPGTTVINVGQNMQINGNTGQIGVGGTNSTSNTITIDGKNDRILIADPTTGINQIIIGLLPDGTYGMVVSNPGIDVLTLFS